MFSPSSYKSIFTYFNYIELSGYLMDATLRHVTYTGIECRKANIGHRMLQLKGTMENISPSRVTVGPWSDCRHFWKFYQSMMQMGKNDMEFAFLLLK